MTHLKTPEHNGLVGPAAYHLEVQSGTHKLDRGNGGAVIVQGLEQQVVLGHIEDMNQPIPTGTGQQLPFDLVVGVLQTKDLRLVGLDGGQEAEIHEAVHPDIATPIPAGQMLQLRADLDASHSVPAVVGGVAALVEQRRALILDELQLLVAVDDFQ